MRDRVKERLHVLQARPSDCFLTWRYSEATAFICGALPSLFSLYFMLLLGKGYYFMHAMEIMFRAQASFGPKRCTPKRCTPRRCTPGKCTPRRCTPGRCIPGKCIPRRCIPEKWIPGRCTSERCTPESCINVKYIRCGYVYYKMYLMGGFCDFDFQKFWSFVLKLPYFAP